MATLMIRGGQVVNPAGDNGHLDILIEDGVIKKMEPLLFDAADETIDVGGCVVSPGFVDVHSHFRDPGQTHKEDILTGAAAAKRGGYTSIVMMANTVPAIDNVETLQYVLEKGKQTGIHIYACATVTRGMQGKELVSMAELKQAGAVGFTDDGKPLSDPEIAREAMRRVAILRNTIISFHEEDPAYIETPGYNKGKASEHYGIGGADREAEIAMIRRDIEMALESGAQIDIQHISTKEGVELVREGRRRREEALAAMPPSKLPQLSGSTSRKQNIHAEATPHHFSLTEEAAIHYGALAKMNPPLRTEEDRQAIIDGLADGTIEMIATDHAPHSKEEKAKGLTEAPSGIIGLETALPLGIMNLVENGAMPLEDLVDRMSTGPARIYGLDAGVLAPGKAADIVIFDPEERWVAGDYASKSENTPFTGMSMTGKVKYTICGGKVVYKD